jgi:predicted RecA/RadA family phage recombinase
MAYDIPGQTRSYEAVADLSTSFYRFVKLNGAVLVAVSAVTDKAVGVLQNKPNRAATSVFVAQERTSGTVMISGVTRCMSGKALAAGVPVYLDSVGRVTDVAQAGQCVGITETSAAAADQTVSVLLKPLGSVV